MQLLWFAVGAVAGSAANAVIDRLPRRESWFVGRSHCDKCGYVLGLWDLVPVFSYLSLGGKCRYCHSPIARRNLVVEIAMAVGFAAIFNFQFSIFNLAIFWVTTIIAVMDYETMLVSDWMVAIWGALVIILNFKFLIFNQISIFNYLIGAGIGGSIIWVIYKITKGKGMGEGDIGIAAVMGWWLGWPKIAPALWVAFVAGATFGLWQLAIGRKKMKSKIAFGPWLILGAWVGYVWGERIIRLVIQ